MRLKLLSILNRGVPEKERLHISVLADDNLNYYAVFDTDYQNGEIAAIPKRAYWFVDYRVKAGDHILLYTKLGTDSRRIRSDGFWNHFFYWGLKKALWGQPANCAVLLKIEDWETSPRE
jgi:hypothetical protein